MRRGRESRAEETAEQVDAAPPAALTGYIGYLLRRVHARFAAAGAEEGGSAAADLELLEELAARDARSQQELAERLQVNRTIMVRLVDRQEAAGHVVRTRDPGNRRTYALSLTPAGEAALAGLRAAVRERDVRLTSALSPAERERLKDLLARLAPDGEPAAPRSAQYLLARAHRLLRVLGDAKVAAAGLRVRHFGPLLTIARLGPCPQQRLARELAITEPATAQLVDELVRAGLVVRGRDPRDRRRYALELTEAGREGLALVRGAVRELQAEMVATLGEEDAGELRALLVKLLPASEGNS